MPMGFLFWLLMILWLIAAVFGSAYPYVGLGLMFVLFALLGFKVFGKPLQ